LLLFLNFLKLEYSEHKNVESCENNRMRSATSLLTLQIISTINLHIFFSTAKISQMISSLSTIAQLDTMDNHALSLALISLMPQTQNTTGHGGSTSSSNTNNTTHHSPPLSRLPSINPFLNNKPRKNVGLLSLSAPQTHFSQFVHSSRDFDRQVKNKKTSLISDIYDMSDEEDDDNKEEKDNNQPPPEPNMMMDCGEDEVINTTPKPISVSLKKDQNPTTKFRCLHTCECSMPPGWAATQKYNCVVHILLKTVHNSCNSSCPMFGKNRPNVLAAINSKLASSKSTSSDIIHESSGGGAVRKSKTHQLDTNVSIDGHHCPHSCSSCGYIKGQWKLPSKTALARHLNNKKHLECNADCPMFSPEMKEKKTKDDNSLENYASQNIRAVENFKRGLKNLKNTEPPTPSVNLRSSKKRSLSSPDESQTTHQQTANFTIPDAYLAGTPNFALRSYPCLHNCKSCQREKMGFQSKTNVISHICEVGHENCTPSCPMFQIKRSIFYPIPKSASNANKRRKLENLRKQTTSDEQKKETTTSSSSFVRRALRRNNHVATTTSSSNSTTRNNQECKLPKSVLTLFDRKNYAMFAPPSSEIYPRTFFSINKDQPNVCPHQCCLSSGLKCDFISTSKPKITQHFLDFDSHSNCNHLCPVFKFNGSSQESKKPTTKTSTLSKPKQINQIPNKVKKETNTPQLTLNTSNRQCFACKRKCIPFPFFRCTKCENCDLCSLCDGSVNHSMDHPKFLFQNQRQLDSIKEQEEEN
jgi:hypothetical protein